MPLKSLLQEKVGKRVATEFPARFGPCSVNVREINMGSKPLLAVDMKLQAKDAVARTLVPMNRLNDAIMAVRCTPLSAEGHVLNLRITSARRDCKIYDVSGNIVVSFVAEAVWPIVDDACALLAAIEQEVLDGGEVAS